MRFELINLGTNIKPHKINLGLGLSSEEILSFIHLLKKYKYVLAWSYEDLKMFGTSIIQHTILMTSNEKRVKQKLRKIHLNLENQIKIELNNLLKANIIFPVRNSRWISNLVPIRKKNDDICICIDFRPS